jgi:glyoxylate utilization-related uncharacterized protein
MSDLFKRAMVVCAAISVFTAGGATLIAGLNSGLSSRFSAYQQSLVDAANATQVAVDAAVGAAPFTADTKPALSK